MLKKRTILHLTISKGQSMKVVNIIVFIFIILPATRSVACPICLTEAGQQVRDGIFNTDFWFYLAGISLPFVCFFLIIYAAYQGRLLFTGD